MKSNAAMKRVSSLGGIIIFLLGFSTALCTWLYALDQWGSFPVPSAIWNDALIDTKTTIAQQHEHPKLLIVSGSSAIAGINAQQMDKALGVNCVNFGSSAGFGLNFILWASQPALNPGDVVLLPLEYEHYDFKTHVNVDVTLLHVIASERKEYFDTLPWLDAFRLKLAYSYGYLYNSLFTKYNPMMSIENWGKPICNKWGTCFWIIIIICPGFLLHCSIHKIKNLLTCTTSTSYCVTREMARPARPARAR